jgi:hypothetical protein
MSLIQEALKRKSEETEKEPAGTPPVQTPVSPVSPTPSQPKTHTVFLIVLIVLLMFALLGGAGIYLIGRPRSVAIKPPTTVPETKVVDDKTVKETTTHEDTPTTPVKPLIEKLTVQQVAPTIKPKEAVQIEESNPIPKLDWPELRVTGIASSGTRRIAIINGKMLSVGRTLGDVIVSEIGQTTVTVELQGECRILYVDE